MESAQETLSFARLNISLVLLKVPRQSVDTQAHNAKMMELAHCGDVALSSTPTVRIWQSRAGLKTSINARILAPTHSQFIP
eukprot:1752714-Pleurochrysis_carterae.AAC.1